ncbi:DUF3905 domain-containing protein [Paenibacillus senegalensis]|uniref:DUF3905 domain-containing protein n=1 Tax=Paenibacillus senegalensis TaxID=1465766 RepID=UPI0002889FB6|nr:DUF3905 domain-containing protein [Paenibacillus senegalensis]
MDRDKRPTARSGAFLPQQGPEQEQGREAASERQGNYSQEKGKEAVSERQGNYSQEKGKEAASERQGNYSQEQGREAASEQPASPSQGRYSETVADNPAITNDDPALDPFEIEFLPEFRENRGPAAPFINQYGVVIGDYHYESPNSPLEQWSEDTDPAVMAGDQWVHPFKDVGFLTSENRDLFEKGILPKGGVFMHPEQNTEYRRVSENDEGSAGEETGSSKENKGDTQR